jgi:hypothetical protein
LYVSGRARVRLWFLASAVTSGALCYHPRWARRRFTAERILTVEKTKCVFKIELSDGPPTPRYWA